MRDVVEDRPSVTLLSRPVFDPLAIETWLAGLGLEWRRTPGATPAEELVEVAGRVCYMSFGPHNQSPRTNPEYILNLISQGHESVLEHASWTLLFSGVSRSFSHQLVRHRVGFSFSQLSQQYADQSEIPARIPGMLRDSQNLRALWESAVESAHSAYRAILAELETHEDVVGVQHGNARERRRAIRTAARSVLPEATETRVVVTANARSLRAFLEERGGITGDEEMRLASAAVLRALEPEAPGLFSDFSISEVDGLPLVTRSH